MENPIVFMPTITPFPPAYQHPPRILRQKQLQQQQLQGLINLLAQTRDYYSLLPGKCTWTFPSLHLLKLNTDGSSRGNPGPSSFGGLIRDSKGRWLCGYMGKMHGGSYTALQAELWAIFNGLCLIKIMNLSFLLIETDCLAAVRLTAGDLDDDHPLKSVIDAIQRLMWEQRCSMIHTKRDGNHCADQLAKLGGRQWEECMMLEEPPELLIPYLLRDMEAASRNHKHHYH